MVPGKTGRRVTNPAALDDDDDDERLRRRKGQRSDGPEFHRFADGPGRPAPRARAPGCKPKEPLCEAGL
jgi:hypothetical protein